MDAKSKTEHTPKEKPEFIPPEEVAEQEESTPPTESNHLSHDEDAATGTHQTSKEKKKHFHLTKKQRTTVGIATLILLVGGGYLTWKLALQKDPPKPVVVSETKKPEQPKPTTEASKLTGLTVPVGTNDTTPVTAVMIENSPDARPQAGLKDAGIVYEAIAEGGITRFATFFQEAQPDYIGPVRSVRPYYLDFIKPYDAPVAHAGGSGEALAIVRGSDFKDLDQFFYPSYYQRISSRYAPHNLYTSRAQLLELQKTKGWTTSNFTGMARAPEKPSTAVTARAIDFSISSYLYNPHYDYDAASNSYKRSEGGKPHTDDKSGAQLTPKVVVALIMPHSYAGIYSVYQTNGSGKAYIFQNGTATEAMWTKADRNAQLALVDAAGKPVGLNPGQTWFTLVSAAGDVTYTP